MTDTDTSRDDAKALVRLFYEALDARDLHAAGSMCASDFKMHMAGRPEPLDAAAIGQFGAAFHAAFRELRHHIQDQTAEADVVATRLVFTGTHTGEFEGIPATGRSVAVDAMTMHRVSDGTLAEQWLLMDQAGLARQLQ